MRKNSILSVTIFTAGICVGSQAEFIVSIVVAGLAGFIAGTLHFFLIALLDKD